MFRKVIALAGMFLLGSAGCDEVVTPIVVHNPAESVDGTTIVVGGNVDITDGTRRFRDVHVNGTLTYFTIFVADLARAQDEPAERIGVSLDLRLEFQRINDYQGVSQYWHAGGKSYDVLDLEEDGTAMTHKMYQLWGISNIAFVNVEYRISRVDIRVHNIWVSYEYPD